MKAVEHVAPVSPQQYKSVSVILLSWKDDSLGAESEIRDLHTIFHDLYHYQIEQFYIPSIRPQQRLAVQVNNFILNHGELGNLLIIYYRGHLAHDHKADSIWTA